MIDTLIAYTENHKLIFIGLGMILIGIVQIRRRKIGAEKELEYWKSRSQWRDRGFNFLFPNAKPSVIADLRLLNGFMIIIVGACLIVYYISLK